MVASAPDPGLFLVKAGACPVPVAGLYSKCCILACSSVLINLTWGGGGGGGGLPYILAIQCYGYVPPGGVGLSHIFPI